MFDLDEIMKRAQAASDAASQQLKESMEKSRKIAEQMQADAEKAGAEEAANDQEAEARAAEQLAAGRRSGFSDTPSLPGWLWRSQSSTWTAATK